MEETILSEKESIAYVYFVTSNSGFYFKKKIFKKWQKVNNGV